MSLHHINNRNTEDDSGTEAVRAGSTSVLLVLVVGTFLAPLDSSIVNIATPAIAEQFQVPMSAVSWVTTAYLLTSASLLLSMGRLGDVWGLRNLYAGGLIVFGAGSLACALSGSLPFLIFARVFQAVGAAMMFAAGPALVTRAFAPDRRGWALGFVSLAVSAGLTAGPALGGLLVGTFGWPSIFLINVPLSIAVALLAWRMLPAEQSRGERFDMPGALLAGGGLLLFLLGLGEAEANGFVSGRVLLPVGVGIALIAALVRWEGRAPQPMIDLRLFRSRTFSAGIASGTLAYMSLFAVTFTMPFWLLGVAGLEPRAAGLFLIITPLTMALLAPAAGRAADRIGSHGLSTIGLTVQTAGLLWLSAWGASASLTTAGIGLAMVGGGMAVFQTPNTVAVLRATPRENAGVGSAFVAEARNVGMAIGIALTAAIVGQALGGSELSDETGKLAFETARFSAGMSRALLVASALSGVAAIITWFGGSPAQVESERPNT